MIVLRNRFGCFLFCWLLQLVLSRHFCFRINIVKDVSGLRNESADGFGVGGVAGLASGFGRNSGEENESATVRNEKRKLSSPVIKPDYSQSSGRIHEDYVQVLKKLKDKVNIERAGVERNCGISPEDVLKNQTYYLFNASIHRGAAISKGLYPMGRQGMIVAIFLFVFSGIMLVAGLVMAAMGCSPCFHNFWGKACRQKQCAYRARIQPMDSVGTRHILGLVIGTTVFLVVALLFAVIGMVAVGFSMKHARDEACQLHRFGVETFEGIMYDQQPNENNWLKGLNGNYRFAGWNVVCEMLTDLQIGFELTEDKKSEDMSLFYGLKIAKYLKSVRPKAHEGIDTVSNAQINNVTDSYLNLHVATLKDLRNDGVLEKMKHNLEETDKYEKDLLSDAAESTESNWDQLKKIEELITFGLRGSNDMLAYLSGVTNGLYFLGIFHILLLVALFIPFAGIAAVLVAFSVLLRHLARGTEPDFKREKKGMTFIWGWHAVQAPLFLVLAAVVLFFCGVITDYCAGIKGSIDNEETWKIWLPNEKANSVIMQMTRNTLGSEGDGLYFDKKVAKEFEYFSYMGENLKNLLKDSPYYLDVSTHQQDLLTLEYEVSASAPQAQLISHRDIMKPNSTTIVHPAIPFSSCHIGKPESLSFDFPKLKEYKDRLSEYNHAVASYRAALAEEGENPECALQYPTERATFLDLSSHMDLLAAQLKLCTGDDVTICMDENRLVCSRGSAMGSYFLISMLQYNNKDVNIFKGEKNYFSNMDDMKDSIVEKCWNLIPDGKPSCLGYYYNSFAVGAKFLQNHNKAACKGVVSQGKELNKAVVDFGEYYITLEKHLSIFDNYLNDYIRKLTWVNGTLYTTSLAYSGVSVVDGACGGIYDNELWIGFSMLMVGLVSIIPWVLGVKVSKYFADRFVDQTNAGKYKRGDDESALYGSRSSDREV